jgi:hypothetical protein
VAVQTVDASCLITCTDSGPVSRQMSATRSSSRSSHRRTSPSEDSASGGSDRKGRAGRATTALTLVRNVGVTQSGYHPLAVDGGRCDPEPPR